MANYVPRSKSDSSPVVVNKVLLEYSHPHLITDSQWLLSYYSGGTEQLQTETTLVYKVKYLLAISLQQNFPTPVLHRGRLFSRPPSLGPLHHEEAFKNYFWDLKVTPKIMELVLILYLPEPLF